MKSNMFNSLLCSPANIEESLVKSKWIDQVWVYANSLSAFAVAVVVLRADTLQNFTKSKRSKMCDYASYFFSYLL